MKKITLLILLSLGLALALFNACAKDDGETPATEPETPVFQLGQLALKALAEGGTYSIAVTGNTKWAAAVNPGASAWCSFTPAAGENDGAIVVTLTGNDSGKERRATIAVAATGIDGQQNVMVTQYSYAPAIDLEKNAITATSAAQADTVDVFSTQNWTATVNTAATWCTLSASSGTAGNGRLIINLTANPAEQQRAATITVSAPDISKTIAVTQQATGVQFAISPTAFPNVAPVAGATLPVTITGNASWTVESSATWCVPAPAAGSGNGTVNLTLAPSSEPYKRAATVTFSAEGVTPKLVKVEQSGTATNFLTVAASALTATPAAGTYEIHIESNVAWTVAKDEAATWCSIAPASGSNNGAVVVTILAYHPTQTQTAAITIAPQTANGAETQTVTLSAIYQGINVNGVIWAPTDVDDPGVFVPVVGQPGGIYQFNKTVRWHLHIEVGEKPGDPDEWWGRDCESPVNRGHQDWDEENQRVCPEGWQMPSYDQLRDLIGYPAPGFPESVQNGYYSYRIHEGLYFTKNRTTCQYDWPNSGTEWNGYLNDTWAVWTKTSINGAMAYGAYGNAGYTNWADNGSTKGNKTRGHKIRCVKTQ
jgi:hypothetical protein